LAEGDLYKFVDKRFKGDIYYKAVFPRIVLGGLMPSRETIPIDWVAVQPEASLELALLEIGVSTRRADVEWRVKINGVGVTKEFKPIAKAKIGDALYTKHVYDVTSILKRVGFAERSRVNITFKREGGGDPITIEHVGLLALYCVDFADTSIKYFSGALSIEPGESAKLSIGLEGENPVLRTTVYMPSKLAHLSIRVGGVHGFNVANTQGMSEAVFQLDKLSTVTDVEYHHIDRNERYAPREIGVSNLIVFSTIHDKPEIVFDEITIPEKASGEFKVKLKLSNQGKTAPDKLLLIVMCSGEVLASKQLNPLHPGEGVEVEIPIKRPAGEHTLVFRAVWRKLTRTGFVEERRKIIVK